MAQTKKRTQYEIMHPLYNALAESDLSSSQCHLMLVLYKFIDGDGKCYPSYAKLLKYSKLSRNTLAKNIKSLSDAGWLSYDQGNACTQVSNTYYLNLEKIGFMPVPLPRNIGITHALKCTEYHTVHKYNVWWTCNEAAEYCKENKIRELWDGRGMTFQ